MLSRFSLKIAAALAVSLALALGVVEVRSSQQRRQPSRRATNPAVTQSSPAPDPNEPRLVSSADEQQDERETPRTARERRNRQQQNQQQQADESRRALEQLTDEMSRLNKKVDDLEKQRRVDLVMERLARAEQRAEAVQTQLRDTMEKEANLQARLDQLEEQSRPENLDRQLATVGSFRPDVERERLRAQYESEKRRTRELIDVNARQRQRLEASLVTADQLVERLRSQLDEETRRELEAGTAAGDTARRPAPSLSPSPTPTPPTR